MNGWRAGPRLFAVCCSLLLTDCAGSTGGKKVVDGVSRVEKVRVLTAQTGIASLYTDHRTASGQRFSASALCAAHRTWPMGTRVRVTRLSNGRQVVVRINDRGPYTRGRVIDLTPAAAQAIGLTRRQGVTKVRIERLN